MGRQIVAGVLVLALCAGVVLAADGVVVSYDKKKTKLIVKVDGKERTIEFKKGKPHVHGPDGKKLKVADYAKFLKKGVKVELEEEDGKVTEVLIQKDKK